MKKVAGSGGGGKGGGGAAFVAKEESDSLRSIAYAQVLDLVSEGEIEGLVNGLNSVYLDETPVIDDNGNENFKGVQVVFREGSQAQEVIPGFPSSESEVAVGALVTNATPVVRSITNSLVDATRITISIPALTKTDTSTGNLGGSEVIIAIEVNSNGGGYQQVANDTIIGKTTSKYQKSYRIDLPGDGPHDIRVKRITPDSASAAIQDKVYWESYTEIIDTKLRFPNSAIMALRVDAANFNSIPKRSYDLRLLKIKVPSNYDPEARTYSTDIWDGEFQTLWSDNPAWILYDLLTNSRYGAGLSEDDVDKWALYEIAQYCDTLIDDGFGGKEPRFTCNCYIQTRTEAYNLIRDLSTVFRGIAYWQAGKLNISQDAPKDADFLFTAANVIDGEFVYSGTSKKDRYTVALVTWNDPDDFFRQKVEAVEDATGILRYGIIQTEVVAFGCTSRGQAHRVGRWILYASQYETETVTFRAALDSGNLQLGQIIKVADEMRAGARRGGRIKEATINTVTLDKDIGINPATDTFTLSVMLPNNTMQERTITGYASKVVTVGTNFSQVPHDHAVWIISNASIQPQTFRIVSISEDKGIYSITALAHNSSKYDYIENDLILQERDISDLTVSPGAPENLKITETLYEDSGSVKTKATFSWDVALNAASYIASYRKQNGNIVLLGEISSNEVEILGIDEGIYEFYVLAVSILGYKSTKTSISYEVRGKTTAPTNVQNFSLMPMDLMAYLSWDKATDLDVLIGGSIKIRYSPQLSEDATWQDAVDMASLPGNTTRFQVPLLVGTYMAKFIDSSGNQSASATLIYTSALEALKTNVVATLTEHPNFTGAKTNMSVIDEYDGLVLTGSENFDDVADVDSMSSFDFHGGAATEGTYEFSQKVDLSEVFTSKVVVNIDVQAVDINNRIDQRAGNVDDWTDFDGSEIDTVNAQVYMATTEDDPNDGGAVWTEWKPFFIGQYKARGFKFKLVATSLQANHVIVIKSLSVTIDMPERTEGVNNVSSNAGGTAVVYEKPFKAAPKIVVTAKNLNTGDYHQITSESVSGFTIRFFDSSGTGVSRNFDWTAIGYGRQTS